MFWHGSLLISDISLVDMTVTAHQVHGSIESITKSWDLFVSDLTTRMLRTHGSFQHTSDHTVYSLGENINLLCVCVCAKTGQSTFSMAMAQLTDQLAGQETVWVHMLTCHCSK